MHNSLGILIFYLYICVCHKCKDCVLSRYDFVEARILAFCWKKNLGGREVKDNRSFLKHCFYCFSCFYESLRGTKSRFGGRPLPSSGKPKVVVAGVAYSLYSTTLMFHSALLICNCQSIPRGIFCVLVALGLRTNWELLFCFFLCG